MVSSERVLRSNNVSVIAVGIVLLLVASSCQGTKNGEESSVPSTHTVLVSISSKLTTYACFESVNGDRHETEDGKILDKGGLSEQEICCNSILPVWKQVQARQSGNADGDAMLFSFPMDQCVLELADLPVVSTNSDQNSDLFANFSWIVPTTSAENSANPKQQFLYRNGNTEPEPIETPSPFQIDTGNDNQLIPLPVKSHLDPSGGMHRLLHHSMAVYPDDIQRYILYVVVPSGMFIDLDDPLEVVDKNTTKTSATPVPGARSAFSIHDNDNAPSSFTMHLHAAKTCDIEQPAFVSGQHVLVWEIYVHAKSSGEQVAAPTLLEFATKLHLRYPQPSATLEQWVDLPKPLLFGYYPDETTNKERMEKFLASNNLPNEWELNVLDPVWVAAGNDRDHDWVMGITMASCLAGVAWMLRDISKVSSWDDI